MDFPTGIIVGARRHIRIYAPGGWIDQWGIDIYPPSYYLRGEGDFVYSKIYSEVILVMVKRVGVGDS